MLNYMCVAGSYGTNLPRSRILSRKSTAMSKNVSQTLYTPLTSAIWSRSLWPQYVDATIARDLRKLGLSDVMAEDLRKIIIDSSISGGGRKMMGDVQDYVSGKYRDVSLSDVDPHWHEYTTPEISARLSEAIRTSSDAAELETRLYAIIDDAKLYYEDLLVRDPITPMRHSFEAALSGKDEARYMDMLKKAGYKDAELKTLSDEYKAGRVGFQQAYNQYIKSVMDGGDPNAAGICTIPGAS